MLGQVTSG